MRLNPISEVNKKTAIGAPRTLPAKRWLNFDGLTRGFKGMSTGPFGDEFNQQTLMDYGFCLIFFLKKLANDATSGIVSSAKEGITLLLQRIYHRFVPRPQRMAVRRARTYLESYRLLGNRFHCPVCQGDFETFLDYGTPPRKNAQCPRCSVMERHRLLWLYLREKTNLFSVRQRMLDVAPVHAIQKRLRKLPNLDYLSIDLRSPIAMRHMDITALNLADQSFDFILCYHVLEHIPDDRKAMAELYRVLKPGGWALLQVPADLNQEKTVEDLTVTSQTERLRLFGNVDHVRIYGRDYFDRLREAGFQVSQDDWAASLDPIIAARQVVRRSDVLFIATRV